MALIFCDSFDHYTTISQKWQSVDADSYIGAVGRWGTNGIATNQNQGRTGCIRNVDYLTSFVGGAAIKLLATPSTGPGYALRFCHSGYTDQLSFTCEGTQKLVLRRGADKDNNGTWVADIITSMEVGVWYFVELKATINATTGSYEVRVNGATVASGSNVNTTNGSGATYITGIGVNGGMNVTNVARFAVDDVYLCSQTAPNNDFFGDVRVQYLVPTADGTTTDFTPYSGSDNFAMVDDAAPGDADYNTATASGSIDSFVMGDIASDGTVYGVQSVIRHWKTDAGTRFVRPTIRIGSTYYAGASSAVGTSVRYDTQRFDQSPATSSGWSVSEVNDMQFGYEVAS